MMFDARKEVPSLKLCQKLKELGFPQYSPGWYWKKLPDNVALANKPEQRYILIFLEKSQVLVSENGEAYMAREVWDTPDAEPLIKAPTVAELGIFIPQTVVNPYGHFCEAKLKIGPVNSAKYVWENVWRFFETQANTEANMRAKLLIKLVKKEHVKFE